MSYCPGCGNEVQGEPRFCPECGASLTGQASRLEERPALQALLSLSGPYQCGLLVLFVGTLLGFIALFVHWTIGESATGYLKDGFGDHPIPWWTSVIALGAVTGVVVSVLNVISTIRHQELPSNGQLRLGGILMAVCPLATHIGFIVWIVGEVDLGGRDFWDGIWEAESPGLWISLTGGILVIWASAIGARLSSLKF